MRKSFKQNLKMFLIIFFSIILFPTGIYSMQKKEKIPSEVIIGGELLQINMNTKKVIYYKSEGTFNQLENFDLIYTINGQKIKDKEDIFNCIISNKNKEYEVLVLRDNNYKTLKLNQKELNPAYFTEYIPFCATLTYINPEDKSFGAVGHNIKVPHLDNILSKKGKIYLCNMLEIKKSTKSYVGSIHGSMENECKGNIYEVNEFGAKGKIINNNFQEKYIYKVGQSKDVQIGNASLVIDNTSEDCKKFYDINITKIHNQDKPSTQSFEFEITDKNFIKAYGGILQGMSGSPIIQNGKLIGALSHVIATDPTEGIGLYIEWMMEN